MKKTASVRFFLNQGLTLAESIGLAEAEKSALESGVRYEWSQDKHATWGCSVYYPDGRRADVMGAVDFGPGNEPWGTPQARMTEAELARGLTLPPELDNFTRAYIDCALRTSPDYDGHTALDRHYTVSDLAASTRHRMAEDCRKFQQEHAELLACWRPCASCSTTRDGDNAGRAFWLARNRIGVCCGLSEAERLGEMALYVGDDGLIYG